MAAIQGVLEEIRQDAYEYRQSPIKRRKNMMVMVCCRRQHIAKRIGGQHIIPVPVCLWQQQGKRQAAYELLEPACGWFTEGFDTADLQEAKGLLDELG